MSIGFFGVGLILDDSKYCDNKMTIQSPKKIHAIGTNQTKLPDFHHQKQHITLQNYFAKKNSNKLRVMQITK